MKSMRELIRFLLSVVVNEVDDWLRDEWLSSSDIVVIRLCVVSDLLVLTVVEELGFFLSQLLNLLEAWLVAIAREHRL